MNSKIVRRATLIAAALLGSARLWAAAVSEAPRPEKTEKPPEAPIVWHQAVVPGPAVTLRMKRPLNKSMIYQGSLDREQKSASSYHEINGFYVNALCYAQEDGRDLTAFLRTFLDRKRTEKSENGKSMEKLLENSSDLIDLGPNFTIVGQALRCYAFDKQNRVAYKTVQLITLKDGSSIHGTIIKEDADRVTVVTDDDSFPVLRDRIARVENTPMPHVFINEAVHYLYPILPERAVAPGDTWRFRVPTIIPLEQGLSAKLLPTQFDAVFNARLREVRETPTGAKLATIDYQITGLFDTALPEFSPRFPQEFLDASRIIHKFNGEGTAVLDVEHGWILERHETFNFNFYGKTTLPPEQKFDGKGKLVSEKPRKPAENKADITSKFDLKLLMPGTRLRSGAVIQSYE